MKILAAVVTYNRCVLLERCLDHILAQTRPADGVLVINNSSTDDTVAMLEKRGIDFVTQPNGGSAGGWQRAIAHAIDQGYDAVWLMDDDGFPDPAALEILSAALTPGIACVSSVVLCEDAPERFVFPFPLLNSRSLPVLFARRRKVATLDALRKLAGDSYPFAHLFNGALVGTEAAKAVGNVNADYFMFGDEVDYFMRLRKFGPVVSHLDARHYHPDVSKRPYNDVKIYYYIKNTLIIHRRYFDQPLLRNVVAVGVGLVRVARRNGLGNALLLAVGRKSAILRSAIARGLRGQIGKDFGG